ncbi:MAG: hypothetical protein ACKVX7_01555 [Planctomycetota bacterium]
MSRSIPIVLALLFGAALPAQAGYVFLKNGYILQGKIVERDAHRVVLSYPDGNLTVDRGHVKHVVLDPAEEAAHAAREAAQREKIEAAPDEKDVVQLNVTLDLPDDLSEFFTTAAAHRKSPDGTAGTTTPPELVSATSSTSPPDSDSAPSTEKGLAALGLEVDPPPGWKLYSNSGVTEFRRQEDASFPNVTFQRWPAAALSTEDAFKELETAMATNYPNIAFQKKETRTIGTLTAEVLRGELKDRGLVFTQLLVRHGEHIYLVGSQWPAADAEGEQLTLDMCLNSLRFMP